MTSAGWLPWPPNDVARVVTGLGGRRGMGGGEGEGGGVWGTGACRLGCGTRVALIMTFAVDLGVKNE